MGESVTTIPPPVPPSEFQATLIQAAESLYQFVLKHRERYLTAWIAETGLRPTQATMVEEHSVEGDTLRAKITIVATDGKPESLLLGQMRRQNEEQAATITALQAELVKHAKVTLVAIEMLSIMEHARVRHPLGGASPVVTPEQWEVLGRCAWCAQNAGGRLKEAVARLAHKRPLTGQQEAAFWKGAHDAWARYLRHGNPR